MSNYKLIRDHKFTCRPAIAEWAWRDFQIIQVDIEQEWLPGGGYASREI